jgi:hypothetical protein
VTTDRTSSIFAARLRYWLLTGLLIGLSLGALVILVLTQTDRGRARVLEFTLEYAAERLNGTLEVGRLEGNLLTGARLYGVTLRGPEGLPFLVADSAFVEYSLRTIAGDEIVLDRVDLYHADIHLVQLPGDTLWNFDRIFSDTLPGRPEATPRLPIVVRRGLLHESNAVIEMAWEPDPELTPVEREREIAEALADTSRILVRQVPEGYLRRYVLDDVDAELLRLVSAPDERGGTSARIERFLGRIQIFREPLIVHQLTADLRLLESVLEFNAPEILLPDSRLTGSGAIDFGVEDGLRLDITLQGQAVAFTDLQWLYPLLPDDGGGSLQLVIETRPDGTLYLARDLDVQAPGTHLVGSFGLILNDAVEFVDVDLRADPLRVGTIEAMLPTELPVVGLRIGGVEIRQAPS